MTREATFKASKKTRNKGHKEEETSADEWEEKEEAKFVRKIKRGRWRYKGKLPFKCFNCGRIRQYAKKCPFEENKGFNKNKNTYSKEYSCSSHESDAEEKEDQEVLFITQETNNDEHKKIDIDETHSKGECINDCVERQNKTNMKQETFWGTKVDIENEQEDLEGKLKYVEEEIVKLRNKNGELKSELNYELEDKKIIKEKLDEAKKNEEIMKHNIKKKIKELEVELDLLTKEITLTTARVKDSVKF